MEPLVVATRNEHKLRELGEAMPGVELEPLPEGIELPPEEGESFEANALGKARAAQAATGRPAIADDSGIEEANLARLLAGVDGKPDRRVAYVCALARVAAGGDELMFEERCE